jgi:hypothetical protein
LATVDFFGTDDLRDRVEVVLGFDDELRDRVDEDREDRQYRAASGRKRECLLLARTTNMRLDAVNFLSANFRMLECTFRVTDFTTNKST